MIDISSMSEILVSSLKVMLEVRDSIPLECCSEFCWEIRAPHPQLENVTVNPSSKLLMEKQQVVPQLVGT